MYLRFVLEQVQKQHARETCLGNIKAEGEKNTLGNSISGMKKAKDANYQQEAWLYHDKKWTSVEV